MEGEALWIRDRQIPLCPIATVSFAGSTWLGHLIFHPTLKTVAFLKKEKERGEKNPKTCIFGNAVWFYFWEGVLKIELLKFSIT